MPTSSILPDQGLVLTRRTVLAALAVTAAPLPLVAMPREDGLHKVARAAAESPAMARICRACAPFYSAGAAKAALRAGAPGASSRDEWMAALPDAAQRDLARRDVLLVEGRRLTRTEVQLFALGAALVGRDVA